MAPRGCLPRCRPRESVRPRGRARHPPPPPPRPARAPGFPSVARHRTREDACGSDRPRRRGEGEPARSWPRAHPPRVGPERPEKPSSGPRTPAPALRPLAGRAGVGGAASSEPPRRPPPPLLAFGHRSPGAPLAARAPGAARLVGRSTLPSPPPARPRARERTGKRPRRRPRRRRTGRGGVGGGRAGPPSEGGGRRRGSRGAPPGGGPRRGRVPLPPAGRLARRRGPRARANSEPRGEEARRGRRSAAPTARARGGPGLRPAARAPLSGGGGRPGDGPAQGWGTTGPSGAARARRSSPGAAVPPPSAAHARAFRAPFFSSLWPGRRGARRALGEAARPRTRRRGAGGGPSVRASGRDEERPRGGRAARGLPASSSQPPGNDPSAGSPTETLLRLLLPLDSQVRPSSRRSGRAVADPAGADPRTSLNHPIGSSDGRCVQRAGT